MLVSLAWATAGCTRGERAPRYAVRDTAAYQGLASEGRFGVLLQDDVPVDTVDLGFGVQRVPGGVVYQRFRIVAAGGVGGAPPPDGKPHGTAGGYVFRAGGRRRALSDVLPGFNDGFSAPAVLDSALYYWAVTPDSGPLYRVAAGRYEFATGRHDTTGLYRGKIGSDPAGTFSPPRATGEGLVLFSAPGRRFWLTPELRLRRAESPGDSGPSPDSFSRRAPPP